MFSQPARPSRQHRTARLFAADVEIERALELVIFPEAARQIYFNFILMMLCFWCYSSLPLPVGQHRFLVIYGLSSAVYRLT